MSTDAEREALIAHVEGRLNRGGNPDAVIDELMADGLSHHDAHQLVASVRAGLRSGYQKHGRSIAVKGAVLIALGAVITLGTYGLAERAGSPAVFTTGLFVVGGSTLLAGLIQAVRGGP